MINELANLDIKTLAEWVLIVSDHCEMTCGGKNRCRKRNASHNKARGLRMLGVMRDALAATAPVQEAGDVRG